MSPPLAVPPEALAQVQAFCASRVPEGLRDEIRLECSTRGNTITIAERRPPWKPELGPEWSELKVAQLRHDQHTEAWSLYCADRNGRWFPYDEVDPSKDVRLLLDEVDADPTGTFWG